MLYVLCWHPLMTVIQLETYVEHTTKQHLLYDSHTVCCPPEVLAL